MKKIALFLILVFFTTSCDVFNKKDVKKYRCSFITNQNDTLEMCFNVYQNDDVVHIETKSYNIKRHRIILNSRQKRAVEELKNFEKENRQKISSASITKEKDPVVDLNDIFGSDEDATDYNATELEPEDFEYLESIGVYYDNETCQYRQRRCR